MDALVRRSLHPRTAASRDRWLTLFLFAFGMIGIVLRQSDFFRAVPGDLGDARFNGLILEHGYRWLCVIDRDLWSPGFFFPFRGALTFSDNHLGTVGVYALLRLAGSTPEIAYIGWFTLAYAANYLCCHYALRRLGLTVGGAAVGAFVFAFAMPALQQAGHAQLGYRFAIPLAALALHRLLSDGRPVHLAWLGLWLTIQFYCSIYLGYFLLLLLGSYLAAFYLVPAGPSSRRPPLRAVLHPVRGWKNGESWCCLGAMLLCGAALWWLFHPYVHYSHLYGFARSHNEIASMLPRLGSYLLADNSRLWGWLGSSIGDIPARQEQQLFVGSAACILAVIGIARPSSRWIRTWAVALLLLVALTLHVHGFSFYAFVDRLPMANAVRAVSRVCLVMLFPLAVLAAAGFDRLVAGAGPRSRIKPIVAGSLLIVLLCECASVESARVPLPVWRERLSMLVAKTPQRLAADAILFVPRQPGVAAAITDLDGMSLAQRLNRNTINGYSGNSPPGFGQTVDPCDDLTDRLAGYVQFMQLDATAIAALAKNVVPVGGAVNCELPRSLPRRTHFKGSLPAATFSRIDVQIADVSIANARQLRLDLDIGNRADTLLPSISDSGEPIRFSSRFVALDGAESSSIGWDSRNDLRKDISSHGSERVTLRIDAPIRPGRYRLQVSLVQEGVAWFHDKGMQIARSAHVIEVTPDGSVSVDR